MDGSFGDAKIAEDTSDAGFVSDVFKRRVNGFLDRALSPDLQKAGRETTGLKTAPEASEKWRALVHDQGWLAPSWPRAYGGTGWTPSQRLYFDSQCADRDAPILMSSGIRTIGPLIIEAGSPEQKAHYLPAILSGAHEWCQGFSEPQAGSDLTALSLRADLEDDHFILNGTKFWTSFAQYATHMFLLARVVPGSTRGDGLVFLLLDMTAPGVTVQPIPFIDGDAETNQVFFDNVRVPVTSRIGGIGDGWATAKQLMAIARSNNTTVGVLRRAYRMALRSAHDAGALNGILKARFADLDMQIDSFEAVAARHLSDPGGMSVSAPSSVLKVLATELHQAITVLALEADPFGDIAQRKYFATRAATIYSGTSETHRNILAKAIGCPRG